MTEKELTQQGNLLAALIKIIVASAGIVVALLVVGVHVTPFHIIAIFIGCAITLAWSSRQGKDSHK